MANKTKIEWTEFNWNFLRGCSRVSEGCRHCYAETVAHRFGGEGMPYEGLTVLGADGPRWNGKVTFHEDVLVKPLRWTKPRKIFVNSMSDLFHESVSFDVIDKAFAVMALTPQHTYQILTKRPERMREYLCMNRSDYWDDAATNIMAALSYQYAEEGKYAPMDSPIEKRWENMTIADDWEWKFPLPNVWLGVSVEDQKTADERIPILLDTPAAVRWISAEPLLGAVDLDLPRCEYHDRDDVVAQPDGEDGCNECIADGGGGIMPYGHWLRDSDGIDWVVVGGESGYGARPMHPDWARSLRDQCVAANVPFFFKQWGEWVGDCDAKKGTLYKARCFHFESGSCTSFLVGKKQAGRLLDGREWNEYPEVAA